MRRSAYVAAALVILVLAAALLLPYLLDQPRIAADLQSRLTRATGAKISWDRLSVRLLPSPRVVLNGLRVAMPETDVRAQRVDVRIALMPLFQGRAEVQSVRVSRPAVRLGMSGDTAGEKNAGNKVEPLQLYRQTLRAAVQAMREFAPDTVVEIRDGEGEIQSPTLPIKLRALSLKARNGPGHLQLEASAAGEHWQQARLLARIENESLSSSARLEIDGTILDGKLGAAPGGKALAGSVTFDLDMARALAVASRFTTALAGVKSAGRAAGTASVTMRGASWQAELRLRQSDASLEGWGLAGPLKVSSGSAAIDATKISVERVTLSLADAPMMVSGTLEGYSATDPIVQAQIESSGIVVDPLLPKGAAEKPVEQKSPWPLPLTGSIELRSEFIRYQHYNFAPVKAVLVLKKDAARLEVKESSLCGLPLPLSVEARQEGLRASAAIVAQRLQVTEAMRCLTGKDSQLSGEFDLRADLKARGPAAEELLRNLEGTLTSEARDGRVTSSGLVAKILALKDLEGLFSGEAKEGIPYRKVVVKGRFRDGQFLLEEGSFRSPVVGLVANGSISLSDFDSKLTVLVAPFSTLNRVARRVPLLGHIIGGALTSLPVSVSGDIRDPLVVPLGPAAVTGELKGIFQRTLELPVRVLPGKPE